MIDNFDHLVERCTARRRTRMIRRSMMIVTGVLFAIALIAAYMTWVSPIDEKKIEKPLSEPKNVVTAPSESNATAAAGKEANLTASVPAAPAAIALPKKAALPITPTPVPQPLNTAAPLTTAAPAAAAAPISAKTDANPRNSRLFEVNTDTKTSTLDPISAYNSSPKYETALAVARDFYTKNNFSEAAIWAKKANQMNREGEEAWMLYAKSYYAQGRKNEAMGVLELYMNYKDSKAAAELLHTWKQTPSN